MTITTIKDGEKTTMALSGNLDTITAPELQEVLIPEFDTAKEVELCLDDLKYISSAGLRVLFMGDTTAKEKNGKLIITGVSENVMEVFELSRFTDVLTIV
ncbi:MAG: STAS domain-containing protein [Eubacteriaceae bacterium]